MSTVTTGAFGKAVWPGINAWYGKRYNRYPNEWKNDFDMEYSKLRFEEQVGYSGMTLATVKSEGGAITYDTMQQGFITRYKNITYATGFIISDEMIEDDQYNVVNTGGKRGARECAKSMTQTKERVCANTFNRAFNSTYKGGDNVEMCSLVHPNVAGGTYQNEPTVAVDISEAALEQACITIAKWTDDRGLLAAINPVSIHIPTDLPFVLERILKSPLRVNTSNNDLNAIKSMGKFAKGVFVNHYYTDTDAWFLRTDADYGLQFFERRKDTFTDDSDFDTDNLKYKATMRFSAGWTDPRGIFGSPGA